MIAQTPSHESLTAVPATPPSFTTIHVWTPMTIQVITFIFGFPVGVILAALNWQRLGLQRKAVTHLLGGGWMLFGLGTSELWLPDPLFGWLIAIGLFVTMPLYLERAMRRDLAAYNTAMQPVLAAQGWQGVLLGFGLLVGYIVVLSLIPLWVFGIVLIGVSVAALFLNYGEPPTPLSDPLD